ncbi:MAG: ThuA domain-containing protein [Bacteroidetes bacterium]|nr:ThuA domain-containing protein [Bacteroidota bacterium]MDA1122066.1 ThuA domain-containing protein [Bacteroidota bacterium]
MKSLIYLLAATILCSCGSSTTKTNEEASNTVAEAPQQWLTFEGRSDMPNVVLVSGDEEYRSEEALPQIAKILSLRHGFNCTVLFAQDPEKPGIINPNYLNNIPGLDQLQSADMMIVFLRFRALPDEQMQYIDDYLKSGKPVLGIRTSTHAFNFNEVDFESKFAHYSNYYEGEDEWKEGFGRFILGEKWISHHGSHRHQSTRGLTAPGAEGHPILNGIAEGEIWGPTDVYGVRLPLPGDSQPIILGQVINRAGEYDENDVLYGMRISDNEVAGIDPEAKGDKKYDPNQPMMPVAWTKSYQIPEGQKGKVFATTLGASTDLLTEGTRRMMVNAVFWCLNLEVPERANVDIVGSYQPTPFAFVDADYWINQNRSVSSLK